MYVRINFDIIHHLVLEPQIAILLIIYAHRRSTCRTDAPKAQMLSLISTGLLDVMVRVV